MCCQNLVLMFNESCGEILVSQEKHENCPADIRVMQSKVWFLEERSKNFVLRRTQGTKTALVDFPHIQHINRVNKLFQKLQS